MQEEVKIMGKYESFHFSPENNRSILMPRAPRGTEYHPPKRNRHRELFPPIPEDKLNHSSPYYQCNLGITEKTIVINGQERKYAIYVPDYKNLSEEEFRWLIRILQKSKKMGTPIS